MQESRMKKYAVIGLSLLAILVIGVSIAVAQEPAGDDTPVVPGANFVDEDGDGQCDLMGTGGAGNSYGRGHGYGAGGNFVDEDGDGQCDLMGTGAGSANFVDEDGDGVCDLAGTGQGFASRGQGGHGFRGGAGNGFANGMGQGGRGAQAAR